MLDTNSLQAGLDKRLSSDFSGMVVLYGMVIEEEKGGGGGDDLRQRGCATPHLFLRRIRNLLE